MEILGLWGCIYGNTSARTISIASPYYTRKKKKKPTWPTHRDLCRLY